MLRAEMQHPRFGQISIIIQNVSAWGVGGKCTHDVAPGELITIFLPHGLPVEGTIVWRKGHCFGAHLASRIDPTDVKKAAVDRAESPYEVPTRFRPAIGSRRPGFSSPR